MDNAENVICGIVLDEIKPGDLVTFRVKDHNGILHWCSLYVAGITVDAFYGSNGVTNGAMVKRENIVYAIKAD